MAELSAAFLDMAEKLQARSDSIQTFATHVSHELKSPLTAIQGAAELLRDSGEAMDAAERQRFSGNIVNDAGRLNLLVRRLLDLARAENLAPSGESTSLDAALALLPVDGRLAVSIEAGGALGLRISAENAAIVLANLIDNSARHGATQVLLSATAAEEVTMTISDDGAGISPSNRSKIFEPFFTTRRESGGTGMGLGIVLALLKAHDGTIALVDLRTRHALRDFLASCVRAGGSENRVRYDIVIIGGAIVGSSGCLLSARGRLFRLDRADRARPAIRPCGDDAVHGLDPPAILDPGKHPAVAVHAKPVSAAEGDLWH